MPVTAESHRVWLRRLLRQTGLAPSTLAVRAGLSDTTLTRFLRDESQENLSQRTIDRLCEAHHVEGPGSTGRKPRAELLPVEDAADQATLDHLISDPPRADSVAGAGWQQVNGTALELGGVMPGDYVFVDLDRDPRPGDFVAAQIDDGRAPAPRLVLRRFEPPFLVAMSGRAEYTRPEQLYDDRLGLVGVVTATVRLTAPLPSRPDTTPEREGEAA